MRIEQEKKIEEMDKFEEDEDLVGVDYEEKIEEEDE